MGLVQKLVHLQTIHGWSDDEMAAKCGMKARQWKNVKAGTYGLSRRALGHVAVNFPGLEGDVLATIRQEADVPEISGLAA